MQKRHTTLAVAIMTWALGLCTVQAAVLGIITRAGSGQRLKGQIKWQAAMKTYVIQVEGGVQMKLRPREVARIQVKKPDNFDEAVALVKGAKYKAAVRILEPISEEYAMLQWDIQAAQWLAFSYLKLKDPKKAVEMCEKVLEANAKAGLDKSFCSVYWDGLLAIESYAKLRKALTTAIEEGGRDLAAVAQLKRGDIDRQRGDLQEALVDGYLRTIVFFDAEKSVQPEAHYKALQVFEELGQHAHAEKMRKRLLAEYPKSEYAAKLRSGG